MRRLKTLLQKRKYEYDPTSANTDSVKPRPEHPADRKTSIFGKARLRRRKHLPERDVGASDLSKITVPHQSMDGGFDIRERKFSPSLPTINSESDRGTTNSRERNMAGQSSQVSRNATRSHPDAIDIDETTSYSQAATRETVRPYVHEVKQEQIHREIHNHHVYHRVQPVYDLEILPARHFILGPNGALVEASENQLPECTGPNQRWCIGERSLPATSPSPTVL